MLDVSDLLKISTMCRFIHVHVLKTACKTLIIPPATKLGGYTGITLSVRPSVCPSVCRRTQLGKIARLGIGYRGGYFVPLGQPHSSWCCILWKTIKPVLSCRKFCSFFSNLEILMLQGQCHSYTSPSRVIQDHKICGIWALCALSIFIRPSSDGTYYGMVMSVRPGLRPTLRPSDSPSGSPSARFSHFSHTCFDILSWNFAHHFVLMYYRSSSSVVTFRQF